MKEMTYSKIIADAINNYLTNDNWNFSFDELRGLFKFGVSIDSIIKKFDYFIKVKNSEYILYAVSPIKADISDEKRIASLAEFICRANYGLRNGNFELDMSDGEIRYKCYVDCDGIVPTSEILRNSINCPAYMFNTYGAGIVDVILGYATATEAIAKCEKPSTEEVLRTILGDDINGVEPIETMLGRLDDRFCADKINSCVPNSPQ